MPTTTTVVIGAGQAGLAMSRCLTDRSIDHVLLERGDVANSWRSGRWDSLRLLTPNWQSRLPGYRYQGDDPDGFMSMPEVIDFISTYASVIDAPVLTNTPVTSVRAAADGYVVTTPDRSWRCRSVVIASGGYNLADVPGVAAWLPEGIASLTPIEYRNPSQLADGGVLIAGASATGIQLAHEIQASGRQVTLAVGGHVRTPRTYRGMDIMWWLDATGILNERYDEIDDIVRARALPTFQLAGSGRQTLDLNLMRRMGVRIVGRMMGITDAGVAQFSGSLRNVCELADLKLDRLLDNIDEWASSHGMDREADAAHRLEPTVVEDSPPLQLDLRSGEIKTVIWATGYRPDYSWLDVPVLDAKGMVRHDGGVVRDVPGMYVIGLRFLRRRKSTFIDGVGDDARDLSAHLASYLDLSATRC